MNLGIGLKSSLQSEFLEITQCESFSKAYSPWMWRLLPEIQGLLATALELDQEVLQVQGGLFVLHPFARGLYLRRKFLDANA